MLERLTGGTLAVALLALAACENEPSLVTTDAPPSVTILAPIDGELYTVDDLVELVGVARDDGPASELNVSWAGPDGLLGDAPPDDQGNVYLAIPAIDLGIGPTVLTLQAIDGAGQSASLAVGVTITDAAGTTPTETTEPPEPGAPTVTLTGPLDGATFVRDDEVAVIGFVADAEQAPDTLLCSLSSSAEGVFWEGSASETGTIDLLRVFDVGMHTVTLTALDNQGKVSTDSATIEVLNDGRPFAVVDAPASGDTVDAGEVVVFEGTVWDDEDDHEELTVRWESDLQGLLDESVPDSDGFVAFGGTLDAGTHVISLIVTDPDGQWASDAIVLSVDDRNGRDEDGDGYSPNDGDCDDADPALNPGAVDACNLLDEDCSGIVNDPHADSYEPNDERGASYDLGEIDHDLGFGDSLEVSGLSLHNPDDEDWYRFYADDEIFDNVEITLQILVPPNGTYVIELYEVNGAWDDPSAYQLEDSVSGNGYMELH
ncbi:MAG: hypothetical protein ACI9K2_004645, partial [Myxococcota bacterium]